ncbi:MAG: CHAT domain-containing protein [Caldilineaceae bacterium]
MGQHDAAKAALETGIHHVESTRHRLTTDDFRAGYLDDKLVAYQDLIDLHILLEEDERAFQVGEWAKARTLAETLGNRRTTQDRSNYPFDLTTISNFEQLANQLASNQLAISYVTVTNSIYAFLIDRNGLITAPIQLGQIPSRAKLESDLAKVQQIGLSVSLDKEAVDQEIALAQQVLADWFACYLAPLRPWLDEYEQLLIAPDGLLHRLPFGACYCAELGRYLIESHIITIVPSLTTWSLITPKSIGYADVLVVGCSHMGGQAGSLPHTIDEAQAVANGFTSATLLLEDDATVDTVIACMPQADLIYMAVHGEYTPGDPAASFLELADQPLRVADILALKLTATTVVLNACETNKGLLRGNEMLGLVRAFLYAGAQSVIATHWPIDDAAGYQMMTHFIQAIHKREEPAAALQSAQSAMIHGDRVHYRHPFFWGGQQLIGRTR